MVSKYSRDVLFDVAPIAMVLLDSRCRILRINKAALKEFDLTPPRAVKKPLTSLFLAIEQKRLEDFLDTAGKLTQRSPHEIFQGKTRNDHPRFLEISATPLEGGGLLMVFHNVSKTIWLMGREEELRLRAEEAVSKLARTEYRLQMALEAGELGVWEMDLDTETLSWSVGLHLTDGNLNFKTMTIPEFLKRVHSAEREKVRRIVKTAVRTETKFAMEYRLESTGRPYRWIMARGSTMGSSANHRILSGVWLDITARKTIESRVRAQYEVNKLLAPSTNLTKSVKGVLKIIGANLTAELGMIWKYNAKNNRFELFSLWKANPRAKYKLETASQNITFKKGECFIGRCTEVSWIQDVEESDSRLYARKDAARADGFNSVVAFPVYLDEETRFVGEYYSHDPLPENREIVRMLTLLGHQLGQFIKRVQTQSELKSSKAQLEAIFQSVSDGITVQNLAGEVIYANEAAAKMTGYLKPGAMIDAGGRGILGKYEIVAEDGERLDLRLLPARQVFRTKRPASVVVGYKLAAGGNERWALVKASPVLDSEGKVQFAVNVFHDVTSRVLDQKSRDLFFGIASHELKTPIAVVKAFAQLANRRVPADAPPELSEYLKKIDEQVDYLTRLIADLMDATRIRAGKFILSKTKFNLDELINETVKNLQTTTQTHKIVKGGKAPSIFADPTRLSQVLINLLKNAIKYSPGADRVVVAVRSNKENVIISVRDFGIGIAKAHQRNLFKPMYRIENHAATSPRGLGLGLFISKAIVEGHGGIIELKSEVGKGSTFIVTLPRSTSS